MRRVSRLRVRSDWGFVKFAYLPVVVCSVAAIKFFPVLAAVKLKIGCGCCTLCILIERWFHHIDEWMNVKPLLNLTEDGLVHEDGTPPQHYAWSAVEKIVMRRRKLPWETNGTSSIKPPVWLEIWVHDGERSKLIEVWPREVDGGLFALRRFAATLMSDLDARGIPAYR